MIGIVPFSPSLRNSVPLSPTLPHTKTPCKWPSSVPVSSPNGVQPTPTISTPAAGAHLRYMGSRILRREPREWCSGGIGYYGSTTLPFTESSPTEQVIRCQVNIGSLTSSTTITGRLYCYGEKELAVLDTEQGLDTLYSRLFPDWISSLKAFPSSPNQLAILFGSNLLILYTVDFSPLRLEKQCSLRLGHKAVMYSASLIPAQIDRTD